MCGPLKFRYQLNDLEIAADEVQLIKIKTKRCVSFWSEKSLWKLGIYI